MKKTRPTRWYHKLFYRWSTPYRYDVNQGLRAELHRGIGIGMRRAPQPADTCMCKYHPVHLKEIQPGRFECPLCVSLQASAQPPQEQTTDPLLFTSERPFLAFVHQQHKDIGPMTEQHRATRLVPLGKGEWKE